MNLAAINNVDFHYLYTASIVWSASNCLKLETGRHNWTATTDGDIWAHANKKRICIQIWEVRIRLKLYRDNGKQTNFYFNKTPNQLSLCISIHPEMKYFIGNFRCLRCLDDAHPHDAHINITWCP